MRHGIGSLETTSGRTVENRSMLAETAVSITGAAVAPLWADAICRPGARSHGSASSWRTTLAHCEQVGLRHPADLPWRELEQWPLGRHVQTGDLDAWCRDTPSPVYIEVLPPGRGGGAGGMDVVPPWLSRQLATST